MAIDFPPAEVVEAAGNRCYYITTLRQQEIHSGLVFRKRIGACSESFSVEPNSMLGHDRIPGKLGYYLGITESARLWWQALGFELIMEASSHTLNYTN